MSSKAHDESAVVPVVQAFKHYYEMEGPQKTQGLIAGLIKYLEQLEADSMPKH